MNEGKIEKVVREIMEHDDEYVVTDFIMALLKGKIEGQKWIKDYIKSLDNMILQYIDEDFSIL